MRIPVPAGACTSPQSLLAAHGTSDHREVGPLRHWDGAVLKPILIIAILVLPPGPIVRGFEPPPTPFAAGHRGVDVAAVPGQPAVAPMGGIVTFAGRVNDRPLLSITNGRWIVSVEPVSTHIDVGTAVAMGDAVGRVDVGGHCSLRCIHVGLRIDGAYADPSVPRRRLLPLGRRGDVAHTPER